MHLFLHYSPFTPYFLVVYYIYCVRRYLPSCLLSRLLAGFRWSQKSLGNYTGSFNISAFSFLCLLMILLFIYAAEAVEFLSQGFRLRKLVWGGLSPTTWAYSKISDFVYIVDLFRVVWDVADGGRQKGKVHLSGSSCWAHYFSSTWSLWFWNHEIMLMFSLLNRMWNNVTFPSVYILNPILV